VTETAIGSERTVHAKGSGVYGTLEITGDISRYTRAEVLQPGAESERFPRFAALLSVIAVVCALIGPIAVRAEAASVAPTDPPNSAASPPPPTVLRGSPLTTTKPDPACPDGYTISPGYGCVGPIIGDSGQYWPDFASWPGTDYWQSHGFRGRFGEGIGTGPR
jgi:hypothetical protein